MVGLRGCVVRAKCAQGAIVIRHLFTHCSLVATILRGVDTLSRETVSEDFFSFFKGNLFLKENVHPCGSTFLLFRVDSFLQGARGAGKRIRIKKRQSFIKTVENRTGEQILFF